MRVWPQLVFGGSPPIPHCNWRTLPSSQTLSLPVLSFPLPPTPLGSFCKARGGGGPGWWGGGVLGRKGVEGGLQAALGARHTLGGTRHIHIPGPSLVVVSDIKSFTFSPFSSSERKGAEKAHETLAYKTLSGHLGHPVGCPDKKAYVPWLPYINLWPLATRSGDFSLTRGVTGQKDFMFMRLGNLFLPTTSADASVRSTEKKSTDDNFPQKIPDNSEKLLPILVLHFGDVSALQCCTGNFYGSECLSLSQDIGYQNTVFFQTA